MSDTSKKQQLSDDNDFWEPLIKAKFPGGIPEGGVYVWRRDLIPGAEEEHLADLIAQRLKAQQGETRPVKPQPGATLDTWFEYHYACKAAGVAYSLKDLAGDAGRTYGYIRQKHAEFKLEREE